MKANVSCQLTHIEGKSYNQTTYNIVEGELSQSEIATIKDSLMNINSQFHTPEKEGNAIVFKNYYGLLISIDVEPKKVTFTVNNYINTLSDKLLVREISHMFYTNLNK